MLTFRIVDASNFAYNLGPEKLDELLRASQEELLRNKIGEINIADIYDLFGQNTSEWVAELNKKFKMYGVEFKNFTIKDVGIPTDMAQDFEDQTLFESKTSEVEMQQMMMLLRLEYEEEQSKLREEGANQLMAKDELQVTELSQISAEVASLAANGEKEIALKRIQGKEAVEDVQTTSMLESAQLEAETTKIRREVQCKMDFDVGKLEAEAQFYENQRRSKSKMEASEKIAEGTKCIAEAEGNAVSAFAARRAQEQELARLSILGKIADNKNIKIASTVENSTGLAPDNSLVTQVAQQGLEAVRMKLANMTGENASKLDMNKVFAGGLVRPVPPQQTMS